MLPFQLVPKTIYRVGRIGQTWELPEWSYANDGRFAGRWDDPNGNYRVRYTAIDPVGALVEKLQNKRPSLNVLAGQEAIEGEGDVVAPIVSLSWFNEHELGTAKLMLQEVDLLDLTTGEGIASIAPGIYAAERASGKSSRNFDVATLMRTDREFTQALGRYVYEALFAGIVYRSRFSADLLCVALFEGRHIIETEPARAIHPKDADFKRAKRIHRLRVALPASQSRVELPPGKA